VTLAAPLTSATGARNAVPCSGFIVENPFQEGSSPLWSTKSFAIANIHRSDAACRPGLPLNLLALPCPVAVGSARAHRP
jgi:hypothetical protein